MNYLAKGKVKEPIFSLYAFHLRNNLTQGTNQSVENANDLWDKIQRIVESNDFSILKKLSELVEENEKDNPLDQDRILTTDYSRFETYHNLNLIKGVTPLKIHDTYVVDLTLAYNAEVKLIDLSGLNSDNCLLAQNINASLGQTLLFLAEPLETLENEESLQKFADDCLTALLTEEKTQELKVKCQNRGKLLGSPIFEYNNHADSPQEQCHVLIWLKTNLETISEEKLEESYYPLIELLLCRSKIIYVRNQTIFCNKEARDVYSNLELRANKFSYTSDEETSSYFDDFQKWLKSTLEDSFKYARAIRDLQIHRTTIRTNLTNYKLHFDKINKLSDGDDLQFLLDFQKLAQNTYIQQISTDLAYLIPGQKLFEDMVKTIRGIVEIEEAKRDKSLERTIQVVGVGLGSGSIFSSVVAPHIKPIKLDNSKYPVHPVIPSLLVSFLATLAFGTLAWLWTKRKIKSKRKK